MGKETDNLLKGIKELGDAGAPEEWLLCQTGKGIAEFDKEGLPGHMVDKILQNVDISDYVDDTIAADYAIQFHQCAESNFTKGRSGYSVDYLVVHYTSGAKTAEGAALANCIYFATGSRGASAHYFIDDGPYIWQSVDDGDTAWHAGNWNMNIRAIGIEVCTAGIFTKKEIDHLHWLVATKMKQYDIPANRVIRHYDVTGKYCPAYYVTQKFWDELHDIITSPYTDEEEPEVVTNEDIKKIAEESAKAVWAQMIKAPGGGSTSAGQRLALCNVMDYNTSDPSGRGVKMTDHDHIKWIAAKQQTIYAMLEALIENVADIPAETVQKLKDEMAEIDLEMEELVSEGTGEE